MSQNLSVDVISDATAQPVPTPNALTDWVRFALSAGLTGLLAGAAGVLMALGLHYVQHLAYGYSLTTPIGHESFLQGVEAAAPGRRILVMVLCGGLAGGGWWAVYRFGAPLVSIRQAVADPSRPMPLWSTLAHAMLQIVTVAMGSPLGREVAPREAGSLIAGRIARAFRLTPEQSQTLIACGAGAGLAAVYNVPLGGAVFVAEVLRRSFSISVIAPALTACVIAAFVSWIGLGNESQYVLPPLAVSSPLIAWSVICGPLLGLCAWIYIRLVARLRAAAPRTAAIVPWCIAAFAVIGLFSAAYPQLLGNGKGPIQLGLDGRVTPALAGTLLLLKLAATCLALRAGAEGGLLTPGMTIGALLGLLGGAAVSVVLPGTALGAFALVGAIAFLATSMRMPLTAIVLGIEFTRADHDFLVPIGIAVAGSVAVAHGLDGCEKTIFSRRGQRVFSILAGIALFALAIGVLGLVGYAVFDESDRPGPFIQSLTGGATPFALTGLALVLGIAGAKLAFRWRAHPGD